MHNNNKNNNNWETQFLMGKFGLQIKLKHDFKLVLQNCKGKKPIRANNIWEHEWFCCIKLYFICSCKLQTYLLYFCYSHGIFKTIFFWNLLPYFSPLPHESESLKLYLLICAWSNMKILILLLIFKLWFHFVSWGRHETLHVLQSCRWQ